MLLALALIAGAGVFAQGGSPPEAGKSYDNGICVTARQINQPLDAILSKLAAQCQLTSVIPQPLASKRMTLEGAGLTLEQALTLLFDYSPIDYALMCEPSGNSCKLRVFDFQPSGGNRSSRVIRATPGTPRPAPTESDPLQQAGKPSDVIDITNLNLKDVELLRSSLGPREIQLLSVFGYDPNNLTNDQILQLVRGLTTNQFTLLEKMGLNPRSLSVADLRQILFAVPTSKKK